MVKKHSILGIVSIILSVPFYIMVNMLYTTDHLDKFYSQNFIFAFPAIFLILPAAIIVSEILALKQKDRNKLFAILGALFSVPVFIISVYRSVITIAYIIIALLNR
jgi:hypothetical protein